MQEKYRESYMKFVDAWGEDWQIDMCIEEMSELTKELLKYKRMKRGSYAIELTTQTANLQEEIADVLNMVEQMQYIFGEQQVNEIRDRKIQRTLLKIK